MKLSYDWLKDFIDLHDTNITDLADKLTMHAFEVEDIEATREPIDATVVLGKIEKIDPHPNADKLQVTQTNVGDQVLQIVCGARNIEVGQLVPVALKGAQVTDRKTGDKFLIKDSKIRAFDQDNGNLLWEAQLPYPGYATPSVYQIDGKEYLVIACGGGKLGSPSGDRYVAFSL